MKKLVVIPGDPIVKYHEKGEVKARYWNPNDIFDEVHIISLCDDDIEAGLVRELSGAAPLHIHSVGRPSPFTLPFFYGKVCRLIDKLGPDVIRAHGSWHGGSLGVYAGRKLGIPCVVSIHTDRDAMRKQDRRWILSVMRAFERYTMRKASLVICVSDYLHGYAREYGAERAVTVYNRVYASQFSPRPSSSPASGPLTVLSVMRLDPPKDPECLIRAVAPLDVKLVLIGHGEQSEYLQNLTRVLQIEHKVEFLPQVPYRDIHRHYQAADLFVMATGYEGFCTPVLEAMAAALPVVASDTLPIPEILAGTGELVALSPDAFGEAIQRLVDDPDLRRRRGEAARIRALEVDGSLMESREAQIYRALMDETPVGLEAILSNDFRYVN